MAIHHFNVQGQLLTGRLAHHFLQPIGHGTPLKPYALEILPVASVQFEYWPTFPERTGLITAEHILAFREIGRGPFKNLPGCEALRTELPAETPWQLCVYELKTLGDEFHILCVYKDSSAHQILNLLCEGKPQLSAKDE